MTYEDEYWARPDDANNYHIIHERLGQTLCGKYEGCHINQAVEDSDEYQKDMDCEQCVRKSDTIENQSLSKQNVDGEE